METPSVSPRIEKEIIDDEISKEISITLHDGDEIIGTYGGAISTLDEKRLTPNELRVHKNHRGHGYGELMMRSLVDTAKELGVETIAGPVESEHALRIKKKLFGEQALHFYHFRTEEDEQNPNSPDEFAELPLTYDQAIQSLERAASFEEDLDKRRHGFQVEADIK